MASIFGDLETGCVRWYTDLFGNALRATVDEIIRVGDVVVVLVVNSRGGFDRVSPAKLYRSLSECEKRVRL